MVLDNDLSDSLLRSLYEDMKENLGEDAAKEFKEQIGKTFERKGYDEINWDQGGE